MAQTPRAKMHHHHLTCVFILMVLSVMAESCDEEHYEKNNQCCRKCGPGTRMQGFNCDNPICQDCPDGEYQDSYTSDVKCKLQPPCSQNLNLQAENPRSKTKWSPCQCKADHHCSSTECITCVKNTVCEEGEQVHKQATQTSDRVCEPCPNETFSNHSSASTCTPWTTCSSGYKEDAPGSSKSDRTCKMQSYGHIVAPVLILLVILVVVSGSLVYYYYRKGKMDQLSIMQKAYKLCGIENTPEPAPPVEVVVEPLLQRPNQPQEDTEDVTKTEVSLHPGISENGNPVLQDNSKSSLVSATETEPESCSDHF